MADPWYSEIELQKVYFMSPAEAYCVTCIHNGYSVTDVANLMGASYSTVRTLLKRGEFKMKKKGKVATIVILKGNKDIEGAMIKLNAIKVLTKFTAKIHNSEAVFGKYTVVIGGIPLDAPGDPLKMNETLFRKADIYGTTNDNEAEKRAEKLYDAFKELELAPADFGIGVLKYLLDKMYMQYDVIE